jgi:hypothetical protein
MARTGGPITPRAPRFHAALTVPLGRPDGAGASHGLQGSGGTSPSVAQTGSKIHPAGA